jgi:hypothetical protein
MKALVMSAVRSLLALTIFFVVMGIAQAVEQLP